MALRKLVLLIFPFYVFGQELESRTYRIEKIEENLVTIDGELDEAIWGQASPVLLDYETNPGNNIKAEVKTILRMAYDNENFYFSFEANDDDPDKIRAIITDRDRLDDNDYVSIFLDPFNDSRRAFFFSINPYGAQEDGFYDEQSGNSDLTWDAIWTSKGKLTETGYRVEGAIPFKSLRFPNGGENMSWRFFGFRAYPRSLEKEFRTIPIDQNNNCLLCQADLLSGFTAINSGQNLEFTPTLTLNRFDENLDFPSGSRQKGDVETNLGLNARWGITTNIIFDLALNPDFSQVEADDAQLDVNNRFALQFPEKRPFFLEGNDFFSTPLNVFFSRTIADPSIGSKITGKIGKNAFGLVYAKDRINNLILPGFQESKNISVDENVSNFIGRYRRDIGENYNIGFLYTLRDTENYYNHLGGFDFFLRPYKPLVIRAQYLHSKSSYSDSVAEENGISDSDVTGNSYNLNLNYETRNWEGAFIFENRTNGFRADAGFVPQVDYRRYRLYVERKFWPKEVTWYQNIGWNAGGFRRESTLGVLDFEGIWTSAYFNGPLQLNLWVNPDLVWQRFNATTFKLLRFWTGFDIQPTGNLGINGWVNLGPAVDFVNTRRADNLQFRIESDIRIGNRIEMTLNHQYQRLHLMGNTIFTANLFQLLAAYNFSTKLVFKTVAQYRHTLRNPELYMDEVNAIDRSFFAQLILSYRLNPRSVLFLGYVDNLSGFENTFSNQQFELERMDRTLFLKVGYAWRP